MRKLLLALSASIVAAAAPAHAQTISSATGAVVTVTAIEQSINSNQMGGMKVSATFEGGSTFSGFWSDLDGAGVGTTWGIDLFDGDIRMIRISMSGPLETRSNDWRVDLYNSSPNLQSLLFEGGASYGSVIFDRSAGFAGGAVGTLGSEVGRDYDLAQQWAGVTVTYGNAVGLGATPPVGDVFQQVSVNFANATYCSGFNCASSGPDGDVPDAGNSPFYFEMDTDKATFASEPPTFESTTAPEPSTYALMAAGLAGIGAMSRRRRKTA